ncbi:MAG: DUF1203 domain-containing protein [Chitinophagaceae bacterium]
MANFKIIPLSKEYAAKIRKAGLDDFGHTVRTSIATGKGPCRVSLQPFVAGKDERLLFSHSPFKMENAFNQPGPVFISKEPVEAYSDLHQFPPSIKADKQSFPLSLIGYDQDQQMIFTKLVGDDDVDELIQVIFRAHPGILYLHARNAAAGCFICKIERGDTEPGMSE